MIGAGAPVRSDASDLAPDVHDRQRTVARRSAHRPETSLDHRRATEFDAERLSEPLATRLLQRASELDAAGAAVTDLRAAAAEAGISAEAFDAALAELRSAERAGALDVVPPTPRRRRRRGLGILLAFGLVFGVILTARSPSEVELVVPPPVVVPPSSAMVEETILIRCLSPQQAAELIRPYLRLPTNTIEISVAAGSRTLNVLATREQLQQVRSVLAQQDAAGSASCAVTPPPAIAPAPPSAN